MSKSPPKVLLEFLRPYDPAIRKVALGLRDVVLSEVVPRYECIYDAYHAVAMGYGPTDRLSDGICHIAVYAGHVNLGFNAGSALADPAGLLQGTGKWIRHIRIGSHSDLARPEIRAYLRAARKLSGDAGLPNKGRELISVVKGISPRKRRRGAGSLQ